MVSWKYTGIGEVEIPKKELFVSIRESGIPLDFTMADFELLIVNQKTANLFSSDEVQLIPIKITGYNSNDNYYLLCIKNEVECVDEKQSIFDKWVENDSIRPDKAGQYKTFYKLVLKSDLNSKLNIFRIKNYDSILIISDDLKKKFEKNGITGVKYQKVTL